MDRGGRSGDGRPLPDRPGGVDTDPAAASPARYTTPRCADLIRPSFVFGDLIDVRYCFDHVGYGAYEKGKHRRPGGLYYDLAGRRGNLLLRNLGAADLDLLPHLSPVPLQRGRKLFERDQPITTVYFPEEGCLSLGETIVGRQAIEVAIVGREGLVGWPALMGCERSTHDAVVRGKDGSALSIALPPLLAACRASLSLWEALLGFVQSVMVQMPRTITANGEYSLERRIARWLLMRDDRSTESAIFVNHDEIADALNVRRASVTDQLHMLEGDRLISCGRGRITVRDRVALGAFCDRAYGPADAGWRDHRDGKIGVR